MMKPKKVLAWHFTDGMRLRDKQPLVVGKTYKFVGKLEMCAKGYHASESILDALSYAPGFQISRVECSGDMETQSDKLVCRNRKVLWTVDAKKATLAWSIRVATDAVKTAKKVCQDPDWNAWADLWISGEDRTSSAADAAADAACAFAAARSATYAAYGDACAADAAYGAACAADGAACAAACAADAADCAAYADAAARASARASARAAARKKYAGWLVKAIETARTA